MEAELPTQPSHVDEMQLDSRTRQTVIQPRAGLTAEEIARDQVATQPTSAGIVPNVAIDMESTAPDLAAEEPGQPYTMPIPEATETIAPAALTKSAAPTSFASSSKQTPRKPILLIVVAAALALVLVAGAAYYFIAL